MVALLGPLPKERCMAEREDGGKGRDTVILEARGEGHSHGLAPVAQLHGLP